MVRGLNHGDHAGGDGAARRGGVYLTKGTVDRKRPYLYNFGLTVEERLAVGGDATSSFISGHTAPNLVAVSLRF